MFRFVAPVLAIAAALCLAPAAGAVPFDQNPVLFVHGIEGSGAQFESQKMRFTSNGYPEGWIDEVDYNSTRAVADKSEVDQQIDTAIAALKQRTGRSQVDVGIIATSCRLGVRRSSRTSRLGRCLAARSKPRRR